MQWQPGAGDALLAGRAGDRVGCAGGAPSRAPCQLPPKMSRPTLTPARLIMAVFFMQAVILGSLYPRYPDIEARLAVGPGVLWIGFLGSSVGALAALLASGAVIERLTPRRTILFAFVLYCLTGMLPAFATDVASLFICLLAVGLVYPLMDVAMNVEANRIEDRKSV